MKGERRGETPNWNKQKATALDHEMAAVIGMSLKVCICESHNSVLVLFRVTNIIITSNRKLQGHEILKIDFEKYSYWSKHNLLNLLWI